MEEKLVEEQEKFSQERWGLAKSCHYSSKIRRGERISFL